MRFLIDSHFVFWWLTASPKLGSSTRKLIRTHDCVVSTVSLIESRLAVQAGKLALPAVPIITQQLERDDFETIPLAPSHVAESARFEQSHSDVYDRLLLGTAAVEGLFLLTRDAAILRLAAKARLGFVVEG